MTDPVQDLVAYLAGEPGESGDRCRLALADPASDLSRFLTAARERTRAALAEPAFRGLGLSPAACLPADPDPPPAPEPEDKRDRRVLPWLVALLALLVAGLTAWAPWRPGAAPPPNPGPVAAAPAERPALPDPAPGAEPRPDNLKPGPSTIAAGPAALPMPRVVADGNPAKVVPEEVAKPTPPGPPVSVQLDERARAVEALAKRLQATEARADRLEQDNTRLRNQALALNQDAARAARAHADCESRAAAQQKAIDALRPLADEAAKLREQVQQLREQVRMLEVALKARPPIDGGPVKPKVDPKQPTDPKKKP